MPYLDPDDELDDLDPARLSKAFALGTDWEHESKQASYENAVLAFERDQLLAENANLRAELDWIKTYKFDPGNPVYVSRSQIVGFHLALMLGLLVGSGYGLLFSFTF